MLRKLVRLQSQLIDRLGCLGWMLLGSMNLLIVVGFWSIPVLLFNPWMPILSEVASLPPVPQTATESVSLSAGSTLDAIMAQVVTPTVQPVAPQGASFEPGTYLVHEQIQPGVYRGQGVADPSQPCYWVRLQDLTEAFESILASGNQLGQFYLEVKDSDFALQVYCAIVSVNPNVPQVGSYPERLAPGMYLIGAEILPGRYQSQAQAEGCRWLRLSGVDGDPLSIIASQTAEGAFTIEVLASDFALSTDCPLDRIEP